MTQLPPPSSAHNTFGDWNAAQRNNAGQVTGTDNQTGKPIAQGNQTVILNDVEKETINRRQLAIIADRLNTDYGEGFGTTNLNLEWYFQDFATKD